MDLGQRSPMADGVPGKTVTAPERGFEADQRLGRLNDLRTDHTGLVSQLESLVDTLEQLEIERSVEVDSDGLYSWQIL